MTLEMWCVLDEKGAVLSILPTQAQAWRWLLGWVSGTSMDNFKVTYAKVEVNW